MSVLDEIIDGVRADLAERQARVSLDELKERAAKAPAAKDGVAALRGDGVKVICEVKRSSPSKGALAAIADPAGLAADYGRAARRSSPSSPNSAASAARWPIWRPSARAWTSPSCARTSSSPPTSCGRPGRTAPMWSC